ncbi:MAG: hypothetical protein ACFFCZ_05550 [Promethearchaeota archaeon]
MLQKIGKANFKITPDREAFYLSGQVVKKLSSLINPDLRKMIEIYLYDQLFENLRHKVGHAWLKYEEFTKEKAVMLIYIIMKLSCSYSSEKTV